MSDRTPTRFGRLATGDIRDGTYGDVIQSVRFTLASAAATANNPSNKHIIRGQFETHSIVRTVVTAIDGSAATINIGTDASAARFAAVSISAGAANDRAEVTPASADVPAWVSTGSAGAVTTVKAAFADVSGLAASGTAYVTFNYIVRA